MGRVVSTHPGEEGVEVASGRRLGPDAQDLAGALHEVSNALTVILGWIERARDERGHELLRTLDVAAGRARDARRIVRRAIGAEPPAPRDSGTRDAPASRGEPPRSLRDVIEDAATGIEPEARRSRISVRAALDPTVSEREVEDGAVVVQILTNLLLNALAFSPSDASVTVDGRLGADAVVVDVSDEGPGVPPDRRATLFSAGVSTRPGGAGFGLRHAASLARAAGGALSLEPSARGARFRLRWPVCRPRAERGAAGAPPEAPAPRSPGAVLDGVRILLVEDDEAVLDLLDTALTARGASIVSVRSAGDLPNALASGPFHAALLDISPIEDDLFGVVSRVRTASPAARVVMMSGSLARASDLPPGCGASWVRKPFEVRELVEALTR